MISRGKFWLIAGAFVATLLLVGIGAAATSSVKPEAKVTPLYKVRVYRSIEKKFNIDRKFLKNDRLLMWSMLRYRFESLQRDHKPAPVTMAPTLLCACKTSLECTSFLIKCVTYFTCFSPSCK